MKFNYKKIASVLASAVMLSSTIGFAAAAYPAPYIKNGASDVAIVYGSATAASIDMTNAVNILQANLNSKVTATGTSTVSGGESYQLKKPSTTFTLGYGIRDVVSATATKDNLPTLLKDGTYADSDNSEFGYTQKLTLANLSYGMFDDTDYKDGAPALGMEIASGTNVLNYTLDFTSYPTWAKLGSTEIEILGKPYYVLGYTTNSSLTLLDSAQKDVLGQDESKTITVGGKSYEVKVDYISSTQARFSVNGELTNVLSSTGTQKLKDGAYIGVRTILYGAKESEKSKVEFSIGNGKLVITNGSNVELNDDSITGLTGSLGVSGATLTQIKLLFAIDGDQVVSEGSGISLPGFDSIKLSYGGFTTPANEVITVKNSGNYKMQLVDFPLKDSTEDITLLYGTSAGAFTGIGSESDKKLVTSNSSSITFDDDNDEYFIVSWTDGKDAESYLMTATGWDSETSGTINKTTIKYRKTGGTNGWEIAKEDAQNGDPVMIGNAELTVGAISYSGKSVALTAVGDTNFHTLYSKEGLKVYLPYIDAGSAAGALNLTYNVSGHNASTWDLVMSEEDKNDNKGLGKNLTVRLGWTTGPRVQVSSISGGSGTDTETESSSEIYRNYVYSALATTYDFDQGGDQDYATITYHGGESYGNFYLTSATASLSGESSVKIFKDSDNASFKDLNLIVVGGSCVNQVAVKLLGGSDVICGDAFTAKTGGKVVAGKYIIKTYASPYNSAKVATLVAGYNADDTKAALSKLITGTVSTDLNAEEIGPAISSS